MQSVQSLNQIAWPEENIGQRRTPFKSAAWRPHPVISPAGVETLEEALGYIHQLYQNGRTDELVSLLRGNPVFREAWQILQQYSSRGSEASGGLVPPLPDQAAEPSALAVLSPGRPTPDQLPITSPDRAALQVTATQGSSPEIQSAQTNLVPVPKSSRTLAAGRQIYENQALYYAQEKANFPRISIRI
ncbi:MAG: hypothetical protein AB1424_18320 [Thermodesulfobacteriota bacterium]